MNYIGSKHTLSNWIFETIQKEYPRDLKDAVFADMFAGTGQVARRFKKHVKQVITNDLEDYSFVLNSHYIGNSTEIEWPSVNKTPLIGNISLSFSEHSTIPRKYFTMENAETIDGIRTNIGADLEAGKITKEQYHWVLASLIETADAVANTASVYGAFLKGYKKSALKRIDFHAVDYEITGQSNIVLQGDANENIKNVKGDILYLDPPYNERQYGANYHVLNHIVNNVPTTSTGITGTDKYNKSEYCSKKTAPAAFEQLIKDADFSHIFVSYNNEGIISPDDFKDIMMRHGKYRVETTTYSRFKANNNKQTADQTTEYLHILEK